MHCLPLVLWESKAGRALRAPCDEKTLPYCNIVTNSFKLYCAHLRQSHSSFHRVEVEALFCRLKIRSERLALGDKRTGEDRGRGRATVSLIVRNTAI